MTRPHWLALTLLLGGVALLLIVHRRTTRIRRANMNRARNALAAALSVKGRSSADACVRYALNRLA